MKYYILFISILCVSVSLSAQSYSGSGNYNRIGLQGKLALIDIDTQDFDLKGDTGYLGGLTTRGRLYNDFGIVYGIDFMSTTVNIQTRPLGEFQEEDTRFDIIGAQLNLLLSYNIIEKHLAIDFGPALLVNGKMKAEKDGQKDNIVSGYTALRAEDIQEISRINGFGIIALTGGFEHVRLTLQYQYGFTNIFSNLNQQGLLDVDNEARNFKGTPSIIAAGIVFYL